MTSRIALITVMTAALSVGGLMAKQDTALPQRHNFVDRMSTALNLTSQQKEQAKTIFTSEREAARSLRQELRENREALQSAIQTGKPLADIQQLARKQGPALGNLAAMRATAFAKFYAVLTPAQQQKLAGLHQGWRRRHAAEHEPGGNDPSTR